ncbi:putative zn(2)-C6 fungal-type DNA-binding domain-containing protein [Septoria linicola]|nr:putative zn(2)-C6 fungal-type DNA-binding domain-containing protein [Septoria linicola]
MPTAAPEKIRRSRITAACAVCRGKRQKCSGEKPVCDQCRLHNEECWWSETKKRGPAKDYLRSLQDRLQDTERLLVALLGRVSDAELLDVLQSEAARSANAPSHQTWSSAMSGQEHWTQHPLTRLDTIRAWENGRRLYAPAVKPEPRSVYDPALEADSRSAYTHHERPSPARSTVPPTSMETRTSMPTVDDSDHYQSFPSTHTRTDSWPQPEINRIDRTERRYSEETREAGEALFSISNHLRSAQQQQQQHPVPQPQMQSQMQPPDQSWQPPQGADKPGTAKNLDAAQSHFPKHLFW